MATKSGSLHSLLHKGAVWRGRQTADQPRHQSLSSGYPQLDALLPGAVVALSVNRQVWDRLGFAPAFATLGNRITGLDLREVAIYGQAAKDRDPSHAADTALIVTFRTA